MLLPLIFTLRHIFDRFVCRLLDKYMYITYEYLDKSFMAFLIYIIMRKCNMAPRQSSDMYEDHKCFIRVKIDGNKVSSHRCILLLVRKERGINQRKKNMATFYWRVCLGLRGK